MRKKIGVLAQFMSSQSKGQMMGIYTNYAKFAKQFGKVITIMPDTDPEDVNVDALILPGGADLSLALFNNGDEYEYGTNKDMPAFTHFYKNKFFKWVNAGVPMFGICLGMQAINVMLGGSLNTDMHSHSLGHNQHYTLLSPNAIVNPKKVPLTYVTNSRHHQAIEFSSKANMLAKDLHPVVFGLINDDDLEATKTQSTHDRAKRIYDQHARLKLGEVHPKFSNVEAFIHKSLKIAGVQWHPEDMLYGVSTHGDPVAHRLMHWLLDGKNAPKVEDQGGPVGVGKFDLEETA